MSNSNKTNPAYYERISLSNEARHKRDMLVWGGLENITASASVKVAFQNRHKAEMVAIKPPVNTSSTGNLTMNAELAPPVAGMVLREEIREETRQSTVQQQNELAARQKVAAAHGGPEMSGV